jgi:hypothetical protein
MHSERYLILLRKRVEGEEGERRRERKKKRIKKKERGKSLQ